MDFIFGIVADAANLDASGKINVLGIFDKVTPTSYPYLHPQMYVVASLRPTAAEAGRKKDIELIFQDPDGRALSNITAKGVVVPPTRGGSVSAIRMVLPLVNTPFPKPGPYQIAILVNGDGKGSIPIEAVPPASRAPRRKAKK
jgi:hypothetical protein